MYQTICTICNTRKLWISLLRRWAYVLKYNEHGTLFAWIAAKVINSLKKHPGNSFQSILSTRWPQTGKHMKKCWEGKHGLIQENRNHMVEGGKINKAVLLKQRTPSHFSSHLLSSSAFLIRDFSSINIFSSFFFLWKGDSIPLACLSPNSNPEEKTFLLLSVIAAVT